MHHFAAVDKTTNKVVNKIIAVRGSNNPDQGNLTFIPLKDGYTVEIGQDWDESERYVEQGESHAEDPGLTESGKVFLQEHGLLPAA